MEPKKVGGHVVGGSQVSDCVAMWLGGWWWGGWCGSLNLKNCVRHVDSDSCDLKIHWCGNPSQVMKAWGHESMVQMQLIQNSCSADNRIHITTHNSGWSNFPMEPLQSWLNACTRTCLLKFHFVILSSILGKWIRVCTRDAWQCMMEAIESL